MRLAEANSVMIVLKVEERDVLFIVLAADGSINRKGTGSPDCRENDLYIGIDKNGLFEQLKPYMADEMDEFLDRSYDVPEKKGRLCDLKILFGGPAIETGTQFLYGELSAGPPKIFVDFCIQAITLTDNWFQEQKRMVAASKKNQAAQPEPKKPWWKFW